MVLYVRLFHEIIGHLGHVGSPSGLYFLGTGSFFLSTSMRGGSFTHLGHCYSITYHQSYLYSSYIINLSI